MRHLTSALLVVVNGGLVVEWWGWVVFKCYKNGWGGGRDPDRGSRLRERAGVERAV